MNKELTAIDRAVKALDVNEAALRALVVESVDIKVVTNSAGFSEAQSARMKLRTARVNLEKLGKAAREDAQEFSKAVIAKQKEYIGIIEPEETRLQQIQDEFTAKIEAEKQAKIDAENTRLADIEDAIKELGADLKFGDTSFVIQAKIDRISSIELSADIFQERLEEAIAIRNSSLSELMDALESVKAAEEGRRLQEEARLKAEKEAAIQREAREKAEAEEARLREEAIAKQQAEERAKAEEERKKLEKQQAEERAARIKAEKEAEQLRAEAKAREDARIAEEATRLEAERKAAAAPDKERMLAYATSLIAMKMPEMSTPNGKAAKVGIEQAVLNLHSRIVAKAEEL